MELRVLKYFIEVAREQNITAAADMADGAEKACRLAKGAQG